MKIGAGCHSQKPSIYVIKPRKNKFNDALVADTVRFSDNFNKAEKKGLANLEIPRNVLTTKEENGKILMTMEKSSWRKK